MKIATLTLHNANNYGAVLQSYALQKYLITKNYDTEIINYSPNKIGRINKSKKLRVLELIKNPKKLYAKIFYERNKNKKFYEFRTNFMKISKDKYLGDASLEKADLKYDKYIVGSDQVWNTSITNNSKAFYLNFVKNAEKISYAASFGKSDFEKQEDENIKQYLTKFNKLSVRENIHAKLMTENYGIEAETVLDPVFLLNKNQWSEIEKKIKLPQKYILVYVLEYSEEMFDYARKLAKKMKCKVLFLSLVKERVRGINLRGIGPREFISIIRNAEYVCTNSFHGTAFSIIFEKKCTIFKHSTRNSRIDNILEISDLKCLYYNKDKKEPNRIDYKAANMAMKNNIKNSKNFLETALKV